MRWETWFYEQESLEAQPGPRVGGDSQEGCRQKALRQDLQATGLDRADEGQSCEARCSSPLTPWR